MLKHDLLIIFRNFARSKSTFIINVIGLSSAMAVALLIYLWVDDEWHFDKFHPDGERIFQVMEHQDMGGSISTSGHTVDFLASTLADEMPEVESATVVTPANFFPPFTLSSSHKHVRAVGKFVDHEFLKVFNYPLLRGDPTNALARKEGLVISESMAKSMFGNLDCIGKDLQWKIIGTAERNVTITGVFNDIPKNASEHFDFLVTFDSFRDLMGMSQSQINWDNLGPFATYIKIKPNANFELLDQKVHSLLAGKSKASKSRTLFLKNFADKYLYGTYTNGQQTGGRVEYVILFGFIAAFILIIACINFTNLSTAKAITKAKSTGIRKAIGAQRTSLAIFYLTEAMVIALISMLMAFVIVISVLPQFNEITGKQLELIWDFRTGLGTISIFLFTSLLAGSYPAFYLSGFKAARVVKGQFNVSPNTSIARKGLVVFQFVMSLAFIIAVVIVYQQIQFINSQNLGLDKHHVLYFDAEGKVADNVDAFLNEVKNVAGITQASGMLGNIMRADGPPDVGSTVTWEDKTIAWSNSGVNYDLIELLRIEMKEGRTFSRDFKSDADKIIVNESTVAALGIDDPIGKTVAGKEIIGVVKNFHFQSFHETVRPYAFRLEPEATTTIMIRYALDSPRETLERLNEFYSKFNPGYTFNYNFLDSDYQAQYASENRVAIVAKYAAGLAIIISCLGLFGLVAFTTEARGREVSIRKVLGSTAFNIVLLLSNDFLKIVLLAIAISLPISYFLSVVWLDTFVLKIDLKLWYFFGAAGVMFTLACLTIVFQAIRASKINPAIRLRSE